MKHTFEKGQNVLFSDRANSLAERDFAVHKIAEIKSVPESLVPVAGHDQFVILENDRMYNGLYLKPAN